MDFKVLKENLDLLFDDLEKYIKTETVIGEPTVVGEVTLVPIINVTLGCASGDGNHNNEVISGSTSGGGIGAKISSNAILVIKNDEVTVIPINEKIILTLLLI